MHLIRAAPKDYLPDLAPGPLTAAFLAGISAAGLTGAGMPPVFSLVCGIAATTAYAAVRYRQGRARQSDLEMSRAAVRGISVFLGNCLLALLFCLGFFRMSGGAWPQKGSLLPDGFPAAGRGVVEAVRELAPSEYQGPRYQVTLRLLGHGEAAAGQGGAGDFRIWKRQKKLLLTVRFDRGTDGEALGAAFGRDCLSGAVLRFEGKTVKGEAPRNPGEFDYTKYLRTKGIYCRVDAGGKQVVTERGPSALGRLVDGVRRGLNKQTERWLDPKAAALIAGCLLGDQSLMESGDRDIYRQAGIAHLFAVSGTHGGILLGLALHLEKIGPFRGRKKLGRIAALALLFFYLSLTGFPLSMRRTFLMACVMQGAAIAGRKSEGVHALALAALILLWACPQSLFNSGFQLSFGVAWGVVYLNPWLGKRLPACLAVPVAAQLAAMPAQAYWFNQIQPAGFLINLWAVALTPPLLILSGIAALAGFCGAGFAGLLWQAPGFLAAVMDRSANAWVALPFASVNVRECPWPLYVLWGMGLWLLPGWKPREAALDQWLYRRDQQRKRRAEWGQWEVWRLAKKRQMAEIQRFSRENATQGRAGEWMAPADRQASLPAAFRPEGMRADPLWSAWKNRRPIIAVSAAACAFALLLAPKPLAICFLDVGQGDGIYMRTPSGANWLVDGGSSSVSRLAEYRLEPFLRSQGVNRLDYVLVSHTDSDHVSGVKELIQGGWRIGSLILSPHAAATADGKDLIGLAEAIGADVVILYRGIMIRDGKVVLRCLHPDDSLNYSDVNDACLVVELTYKDFSFLLTGDIDSKAEEHLMGQWREASLLKVAHHGSKYSSAKAFLDKVKPKAAVVSSSRNNVYGHPHPDTLARLEEAGSRVYLTMERGAVQVSTRGKRFRIKGYIG